VTVATVAATDGLSGDATFDASVASSEPGDGEWVATGSGLDARTISLRADRSGSEAGRLYTLSASAADRAGNTSTASVVCIVPHDKGK
jgi:hypothetical protein